MNYLNRKFSKIQSIAASLTIIVFVLYLRRPDAFYRPQFWAEDGVIFFHNAYHYGVQSLLLPYNGYFHLYPRLVALLGDWIIPLVYLPHFYYVCFFVAISLVVFYLHSSRLSLKHPFLMSLALIVAPTQNEVFLGVLNAQWILALMLALLVTAPPPRSLYERILDCLLLVLLGFTGPFIILVAPLFFVCFIARRTKHDFLLLVITVNICLLSAIDVSVNRLATSVDAVPAEFLRVIAYYLFSLVVGPYNANIDYQDWTTIILSIGAIVGSIGLSIHCCQKRLYSIPAFIFIAAVSLTAAIYAFRNSPGILIHSGDRYFYIPTVLFVWSIILLLPYQRKISQAILIWMLCQFIIFLPQYRLQPLRNKRWQEQITCLDLKPRCKIPINPKTWSIAMQSKSHVVDTNL